MCEGSASFAVDCDRVEGACDGREVLPVGLLTRPRSDSGRSCERVNVETAEGLVKPLTGGRGGVTQGVN